MSKICGVCKIDVDVLECRHYRHRSAGLIVRDEQIEIADVDRDAKGNIPKPRKPRKSKKKDSTEAPREDNTKEADQDSIESAW